MKKKKTRSAQANDRVCTTAIQSTHREPEYVFWFISSRWNSSSDLRSMTGFIFFGCRGLSEKNRSTVCSSATFDWDTKHKKKRCFGFKALAKLTIRPEGLCPRGKSIQQVTDLFLNCPASRAISVAFLRWTHRCVRVILTKQKWLTCVEVERVRHLRSSALVLCNEPSAVFYSFSHAVSRGIPCQP